MDRTICYRQDLTICGLQGIYLRCKDTHRLKVKGWKKTLYDNDNQKKAGVTIVLPDKVNFKTKTLTRDKNITQ